MSKTLSDEDYLPEFNLPIEKFWGNHCQIALTDPLLKNSNSYKVNSNTGTTKENAIMEGNAAHLSVERDSSNMSSMIFYSVQPNSTKGTLDQSIVSKVAIDFTPGISTQHLNVPIYKDSLKEGIESFNVDFYKSFYDTTPFNEIKLFVKDAIVDNSIYIMTNVDSDVAKEGWRFTLNIERSDTSTASTVYIETVDQTAVGTDEKNETGSGLYTTRDPDYIKLNKVAIDFKVGQKNASIDIRTIPDTDIEGMESLGVNLYKYFTDTKPSASGTVKIADNVAAAQTATSYHYTMTSDSSTEDVAKNEGEVITFTVKRDATGTESTIFLSNEDGSAYQGADYLFAPKELIFSADQDTLTFSIDTLSDDEFEPTEIVNIGLRVDPTATTPDVIATSYIKNANEPFYNYSITSSASSIDSSIEEGNDVIFTITRDQSGTESTIYIDTFNGQAISKSEDGSCDYENISQQEVIFAPNETTKIISVKTYEDSNTKEGVEDFGLGLYNFKSDIYFSSYTTAYLHDVVPDNYTYSLDQDEYDVSEGASVTFSVTRSATGTPSSVFLWTDGDMATDADFEAIDGMQIDFDVNETVKEITVNAINDDVIDEPVYEDFGLYLYKYYNDADESYISSADVWIKSNKINDINGTKKVDTLLGTSGQDNILGMAGNDQITGNGNQDILTGGAGNDTFIFKTVADSLPDLPDVIEDFTKGDKINLKAIDANINIAKDQAFTTPVIGAQFSGVFSKPSQLFFDITDQTLYGNVDSDSGADFAIEFVGVTKLVASDFVF